MNIIMPLAGRGSRFSASHNLPKPLIDILGKPMIQWAIESLDLDGRWFFVINQGPHAEQICKILQSIKPTAKIKVIDYITEGPACTAMLFSDDPDLDPEDELVIANCDQVMEWSSQRFLDYVRYYDGAVVTYHCDTDKNSYARINPEGLVQEIREKEVISNVSLNGIHYWKKTKYFIDSTRSMIAADDRAPNGEFYVGPSYNYMIKDNLKVGIFHIPNQQHHPVGVPIDLENFINYEKSKTQ